VIILGIETSCDDTSAAVVDGDFAIHSNVVASQEDHAAFGGVVPELASRAHTRLIVPVVRLALERAGMSLADLDGIAVTHGPGLLGSLLVGVSFAKALAYGTGLPLAGVNHLEGHLWSGLHAEPSLLSTPFLALIVSGGHSELVMVNGFGDYVHLGGTQDDAAGEAFDKVAKLLGLGYPGGPEIERLAREVNGAGGAQGAGAANGGDGSDGAAHRRLKFPVAVTAEPFDLSFSGLKTAVRYHLANHPPASRAEQAAVAHAFQETVVESLVARVLAVLDRYPVQHVVVCGGVARNGRLRARLAERLAARRVALTVPAGELCTDNGAMIGFVGSLLLRRGRRASLGLGAAASLAEVGWES
jgi:N6-L-threonylcarbamoyladenine synthase